MPRKKAPEYIDTPEWSRLTGLQRQIYIEAERQKDQPEHPLLHIPRAQAVPAETYGDGILQPMEIRVDPKRFDVSGIGICMGGPGDRIIKLRDDLTPEEIENIIPASDDLWGRIRYKHKQLQKLAALCTEIKDDRDELRVKLKTSQEDIDRALVAADCTSVDEMVENFQGMTIASLAHGAKEYTRVQEGTGRADAADVLAGWEEGRKAVELVGPLDDHIATVISEIGIPELVRRSGTLKQLCELVQQHEVAGIAGQSAAWQAIKIKIVDGTIASTHPKDTVAVEKGD